MGLSEAIKNVFQNHPKAGMAVRLGAVTALLASPSLACVKSAEDINLSANPSVEPARACTCSTKLEPGEMPFDAVMKRCMNPDDPDKPAMVIKTTSEYLQCSPEGSKGGCKGIVRPGTIVTLVGPCGSEKNR